MKREEFSAILLDIYKASAVPVHWQAVLEKLSRYVRNGKSVLTRRSNIDGHIDVKNLLSSKIHNIEQEYVDKYIREIIYYDVWTPCEQKHQVGELCIFSENLPLDELQKTKYYRDWLAPQGINDGIAIQLYNTDIFRIVLNVLYDHESDNINALHNDLKILTPHLCQSVELWMASLEKDDSCYAVVNSDYLENKYDLTPREAEIANLTARLGTYKEIGDYLGLAESTIKSYCEFIKNKMGVRRKHDIMLIASGFIGYSKLKRKKPTFGL